MILFVAEILRYPGNGNSTVVFRSMSMMLGRAPKIAAKATSQYLLAQPLEHYAHGMILAQLCMMLRWKLETDVKFERIGTQPHPYLEGLDRCWKTGTLPTKQYIPEKLLRSALPGERCVKPWKRWRPSNYEYLDAEMEKVA